VTNRKTTQFAVDSNFRQDPEAGLSSEEFANGTSETIKAGPFLQTNNVLFIFETAKLFLKCSLERLHFENWPQSCAVAGNVVMIVHWECRGWFLTTGTDVMNQFRTKSFRVNFLIT
jgi:hypothetical protein